MLRKIGFFSIALLLTACAGDPPERVPVLRVVAENANRTAIVAAQSLRWESAVESWREALVGYQAMDDWQGQGRARLGLGHAYVRLGRIELARQYLEEMPEQALFSDLHRASAAYQLALLEVSRAGQGQPLLDAARRLCGQHCPLAAQLDNLAARLAAGRGDWAGVNRWARSALDAAESLPGERAHAHRLLAEAALVGNAPQAARAHLDAALVDDRRLAEPEWLLEDYRLLERVAVSLSDDALARDAQVRQKSLCAAVRLPVCSKLVGGSP